MRKAVLLFMTLLSGGLSGCFNVGEDEKPEINCETEVVWGGHTYKVVRIGSQCWFAENLKIDAGKEIKEDTEWFTTESAWCYFNNDPSNEDELGKLYNWYAISNEKICPDGWRVPTDDDWTVLQDELGGIYWAGQELKSTSGWDSNGNGTNSSGFNAVPTGYRSDGGTFYARYSYSYFWSTTIDASNDLFVWVRRLDSDFMGVNRGGAYKTSGKSCRCVKE